MVGGGLILADRRHWEPVGGTLVVGGGLILADGRHWEALGADRVEWSLKTTAGLTERGSYRWCTADVIDV